MERKINLMDAFPIYGYQDPVLMSKEKGCISIAMELRLPEIYTLDSSEYDSLNELWHSIMGMVGENVILAKQDIFLRESYTVDQTRIDRDFFEFSDERHFQNRHYLTCRSFLCIHWVPRNYINRTPRSANQYLQKKRNYFIDISVPEEYLDLELANEFESKVSAVNDLIQESGLVSSKIMTEDELFGKGGYYDIYLEASREGGKGVDINFEKGVVNIGKKIGQYFTLENLDQFDIDVVSPSSHYAKFEIGDNKFPVSNLFHLGFKFPYEHIINQYVYVPEKEKAMKGVEKKLKRLTKYAKNTKGDANTVYAGQISDFQTELLDGHKKMVYYHLNVLGLCEGESEFGKMTNLLGSAFKKIGVDAKQNSVDRKNLFFGGILGNGIGLGMEMYIPVSSDLAASLFYQEGGYDNPCHGPHGMRVVDRVDGKPILLSMYREPEKLGWIFNRGMIVASGSGGGKTFFTNTYLYSELREGAEVIMMENGNSYDKLVEVFGGVIIQNEPQNPFTFNPFVLDSYDIVSDGKQKRITDQKSLQIHSVVLLLLGNALNEGNNSLNPSVTNTLIELLIDRYFKAALMTGEYSFDFNGFFRFIEKNIAALVEEKNIRKELFDKDVLLLLLGKYAGSGPRSYLLNSTDNRIARLSDEKFVYFKLGNLIENKELFPIVAFLMMDIFDKKLMDESKLHINKILGVDEAWNLFDNPIMAKYFDGQSRMARKFGGQPIFISQKVDDFVKSKHIGKSLIVNSHIKALLDMREFANSFDEIMAILGLDLKQKQGILSLNRDLPKGRKLREGAICWKNHIKVFGIESSLETKCIFETNPVEKTKINKIHRSNGENWTTTATLYSQN